MKTISVILLLICAATCCADHCLQGKVVTACYDNCFYVEEVDRSSGVAVVFSGGMPCEGDLVSAEGVIRTWPSGERYFDASVAYVTGHCASLPGVGLANKLIGGGAFSPYTCGVVGGVGLNNVGLLVTVWGQVQTVTASSFNIVDGSSSTVLEVSYEDGVLPNVGEFVVVTGIVSLKIGQWGPLPLIRARCQEDIVVRN